MYSKSVVYPTNSGDLPRSIDKRLLAIRRMRKIREDRLLHKSDALCQRLKFENLTVHPDCILTSPRRVRILRELSIAHSAFAGGSIFLPHTICGSDLEVI